MGHCSIDQNRSERFYQRETWNSDNFPPPLIHTHTLFILYQLPCVNSFVRTIFHLVQYIQLEHNIISLGFTL